MKLIDILVRDLDKFGGWPEEAVECHRFVDEANIDFYDKDGQWWDDCFLKYGNFAQEAVRERVITCESESVTREQYEAALAASKPEWDGEGLPPVGCRVEVKADDFEGGWLVIDVVYVHNGEVVGIVLSENEYLNDRLEKFSAGYNRAEFRPKRSEEDRRRDATCDAMHKIWREVAGQTREDGSLIDIYSCIYDAIAAGKIPHIRID